MIIRLALDHEVNDIADVYSASVRELCKNDYRADLIVLWQSMFCKKKALLSISKSSLWVAEIDGRIAGYLVSIPGELISLFVSPLFSGQGVGRELGLRGIEIAKVDESTEVKVESTLTAAPFYEKLGFVEVDRGYFTHGHSELRIPVVNMILSS